MLRVFGNLVVKRYNTVNFIFQTIQIRKVSTLNSGRLLGFRQSLLLQNRKTLEQCRVFSILSALRSEDKNDGSNNDNEINEDAKNADNDEASIPTSVPEVWPHLPLLATRTEPVFPRFVRVLEISDPRLMDLIRRKVSLGQPFVGIFLKKDSENEKGVVDSLDDVYSVGSFAQIQELQDLDSKILIVVLSHRRIKITGQISDEVVKSRRLSRENREKKDEELAKLEENLKNEAPLPGVLMVEVENFKNEPFENTDVVKALTLEIFKSLKEIFNVSPDFRQTINFLIYDTKNPFEDLGYLCDVGAFVSTSEPAELQNVMEEVEIPKRLVLVLDLLKKRLYLSDLQEKIAKQVEERIKVHHRKYMLNEQMKVIKKELGIEKNEKDAIHEEYEQNLKDKIIPEYVMTIISEELNKLNFLETHSVEFNVSRNYLDWLTNLPWGITTRENLDLTQASAILEKDHYGMEKVKQRILEFIAVSYLRKHTQGKILCLHGPPGVGKTSIAASIAKALNREYCRFSVGGLSDVAEIKGHRRTYVGAMPGKIIQCLKKTQTENPIILIDEIDKISRTYQGDPASAMLELLDPEQNLNFLDHYLDVPVDLSRVLFVCTANDVDSISGPLRDRMELIEMSGYIAEEKVAIARQYLIPTALQNSGLTEKELTIDDSALQAIIKYFCRESGVRNLQKLIEKIIRKVAYKLVTKESESFTITDSNLTEFLGKQKFTTERLYDVTPPGVVMGLAWTSMGGSALYIETSKRNVTQNTSKMPITVHTTGNLGRVMKESVHIALTVANKFISNIDENNTILGQSEIHVHIPEGATPKDGPSAGVTITTALISLALNKPVNPNIAMTGEISLTGRVLNVGGIKEKVIAAKRSGIKCVLLPDDNKKDFDDLPPFIKKDINAHFVKSYDDIHKIAFES